MIPLLAYLWSGVAFAAAPVAHGTTAHTAVNTSVRIALVGTDADGDTLTYSITSTPSAGIVTLSGATVTFTPSSGFRGVTSFRWRVVDPSGASSTATTTVRVY